MIDDTVVDDDDDDNDDYDNDNDCDDSMNDGVILSSYELILGYSSRTHTEEENWSSCASYPNMKLWNHDSLIH